MQGNEQSQDVGNLGAGRDTISWTVDQTRGLELAYMAAVEADEPSFVFEDQEFETLSTYHLVTYLIGAFYRRNMWPYTGESF
jgi:hypothetical protein